MVNIGVLKYVDNSNGRRHILFDVDDSLTIFAVGTLQAALVVSIDHLVLLGACVESELQYGQEQKD